MKVHKYLVVDQKAPLMCQLAEKNNTAYGTCGYITLALATYLANLQEFNPSIIDKINIYDLLPAIEDIMKIIMNMRKFELKKYYKLMNDSQRKSYLKDYVANYQISEYLEQVYGTLKNKQVYFFRQCAYDHPKEMQDIKWEEKERIIQQEEFKGQKFFYSSFAPYSNHHKEHFEQELRKANPSLPVIIATDILGHYNTTILFEGQVYILDSLTSYKDTKHDSTIVECIEYLYKQSYLIKDIKGQEKSK